MGSPITSMFMSLVIYCFSRLRRKMVQKSKYLKITDGLNKGNERYPARQDTDIHEVSMVSAPHRSGPATSRRLDDWRLLGGSPTEPKEHQPQRNQYRHRRGVTDHGPRCVTV